MLFGSRGIWWGAAGWVQVGGGDQLSGEQRLPGIPVIFFYISNTKATIGESFLQPSSFPCWH